MAIENVRIGFRTSRAGGQTLAAVPFADIKSFGTDVRRICLETGCITRGNYKGKAVGGEFFAVITDSDYILFGEEGEFTGKICREEAGDIVMVDSDMLICLKDDILSGYDMSGKRTARNKISAAAVERIRGGY